MTVNANTLVSRDIYRLERRVGILLGLHGEPDRSLTEAFTNAGLELLADSSYFPELDGPDPLEPADLSHLEEHLRYSFQPVPAVDPEETPVEQPDLFDEIEYLVDRVLTDSILRYGILLDRYRVATRDEGNGFPVLFQRDEQELWWQLAVYPTQEQAIVAVNELRRLLVRLSIASEGLRIIEHLLLRPLSPNYQDALGSLEFQREFYSFKLSVFFPAWTARCSDPGFRRLAENTVRESCPAHIYPNFQWLAFSQMQRLEELQQSWLATRNDPAASTESIDAASLSLARFIIDPDHTPSDSAGECI